MESFSQISQLAFCLTPESLADVVFDNIDKPINSQQLDNICYYLYDEDEERMRNSKLNLI